MLFIQTLFLFYLRIFPIKDSMPDWMTAEELINAGYNIGNIEFNLVYDFVR